MEWGTVRRSRRWWAAVAAAALLIAGATTGCTSGSGIQSERDARSSPSIVANAAVPDLRPELPRGGRTLFPRSRLVALYGAADGGGLGALGIGTPDEAAVRLDRQAADYVRPGRPVLPVMELIVTVADPTPGPNGCYAHDTDIGAAWRYLQAARAHRQLLVLDIQPGQCDFLAQTKRWEPLLVQPDVGLALDAEWRMPRGVAPGTEIGSTTAAEVNTTTAWLAALVREHDLPQKPVVLHQFTPDMIIGREALDTPPELAMIGHVDGFGTAPTKITKYRELTDPRLHTGFKLFYTQDTGLMTPDQVLALAPGPDYISYQ